MRRPIPSQLRLTLQLVALFSVVTLASFALAWGTAERALRQTLLTTLDQELAELAAEPGGNALAAEVARLAAQGDGTLLVRFDPGGGAAVVGDPRLPAPTGAAPPDRAQLIEIGDDRSALIRSVAAQGGRLVVGADASDLAQLSETFLSILLWTLIPACLAALAGGLLLARRSLRRIEAIDATLARLTAGHLDARMPADAGPVDDLHRIGSGIDRLAEAQQASVQALQQVTADIAHDLKTPLQRLSLLVEDGRTTPHRDRVPAILDRAAEECRGMAETFRALLEIAQLDGDQRRLLSQAVDLGPIATGLVELYAPSAEESGHRIDVQVTGDTRLTGDRVLLGRLLANLIENGLRHTASGSRIAVSVAGLPAGVRLTVADDGPGIPEAERAKVTRRLYRLEASRTTPGSGLGLSLVEAIARWHGATLTIGDNDPGLRVDVAFPCSRG